MSSLGRKPPQESFSAFDHLATMVVVVDPQGRCSFANSALEEALGLSRRHVLGASVFDWFVENDLLRETVAAVSRNQFSTSRLEGHLRRFPVSNADALAVHVIVNQMGMGGQVVIELIEVEQQARQDREERALDQAQANKELIRNLAHEIKNPLGGIRGAAQLLEMEIGSKPLTEYNTKLTTYDTGYITTVRE